MKKAITVILAIALLAAMALPAVADAFTLYATKDGVRVYAKKNTSAKVYRKLSRGEKVLIEQKSGKWYAILVEDPTGDGQTLGWIQAKYLSTTKPSREKKKATAAPRATVSPQKEINRLLDTMKDVAPYAAEVVTKTEKGTVALRRQPSTGGALITHLMNGARIRVLAEGDGWFQVSDPASGNTGYMASKYIVKADEVASNEEDDVREEMEAAQAERGGSRTVMPMDASVDINQLPDGDYPVAFDRGDVARLASGVYMNAVSIYAMDRYAAADIEGLAAGDTVVVEGKPIAVEKVEATESLMKVNGGLGEENGCDFGKNDDGSYSVYGYDDLPTYTQLGVTTLVVDEAAVFEDSSDIDGEPVSAEYSGLVEAMQGAKFDSFYANNTTVTIRSGRVTRIARVYTP